MNIKTLKINLVLTVIMMTLVTVSTAWGREAVTSIQLDETEYLFRWSKGDQYEYTPKGDENLSRWVDMVTINYYPGVTDETALAKVANAVLENYKKYKAIVLRTNSVPATKEKPGEYFISVVLGQPDFLEFVQARFLINKGTGVSAIYSHRIYGKKVGPEMSAWMKKHAVSFEKELMQMKDIPTRDNLKHLSN